MTSPILQFSLLLFFLFALHIYFLVAKLSNRNEESKLNTYDYIIIISATSIAITLGAILSIDLLSNYLEDNNPLNLIKEGKDFAAILVGLATVLALIYQTRENQRTTQKQIDVAQESLDRQLKHATKISEIETLKNTISSLSNEAKKLFDSVHPIPRECLEIMTMNDYNSNYQINSYQHNYEKKYSTVTYNNGRSDTYQWRNNILYLKIINDKHEKKFKEYIDIYLEIECVHLAVQFNKLILTCAELANIDDRSFQNIKFFLAPFINAINELNKAEYIENQVYNLFSQLISIHKGYININDSLKKVFIKELSKKYNIVITEKTLINIEFKVQTIDGIDIPIFAVNIEGTVYFRMNSEWTTKKIYSITF